METTTIQVSDRTKDRLDELKRKWRLRSYDAVVRKAVLKRLDTPRSLAGAFPDLEP